MKHLSDKETILQILQEKHKKSSSNKIYVYKNDFTSLSIKESDITRHLYILSEEGLFSIIKDSVQKDLSTPWIISFTSDGINYFADKKQNLISKRREWIKTYIPIAISSIALIKSFMPEITSIWKLIVQVLK